MHTELVTLQLYFAWIKLTEITLKLLHWKEFPVGKRFGAILKVSKWNQTTNIVQIFYSPKLICCDLQRLESESQSWRSCSDGEMDAKDALYITTPFIPPSIMLLSSSTTPTFPPRVLLLFSFPKLFFKKLWIYVLLLIKPPTSSWWLLTLVVRESFINHFTLHVYNTLQSDT